MNKAIKAMLVCALLATCAVAHARKIHVAQTLDGRTVTRVTFDGERVTLWYENGNDDDVDLTTIISQERYTAIDEVNINKAATDKQDGLYDLQGRRVSDSDLTPGIYVQRRDGKSVKVIKK